MSAVVVSPATVSLGTSPAETATVINNLLASPIETFTVGQLTLVSHVMSRLAGGGAPTATLSSVLGVTSSASTSGTKTVTQSLAPHLPASLLTTILATPPQNVTATGWGILADAISRTSAGSNPANLIGAVLR